MVRFGAALLLLLSWRGLAEETVVLFAPMNESVVAPGNLRVVGKAAGKAELLLDGKAVRFESPAPGVVHAELKPGPGLHELLLKGEGGEAKAAFFSGKEHGGWKMFRPHPPIEGIGCDTCHAVKNGEWAMKRATLSPICHTCHDLSAFPKIHTHDTGTLADCQNCHYPHGSTAKGNLRAAREVVCRQCHDLQ